MERSQSSQQRATTTTTTTLARRKQSCSQPEGLAIFNSVLLASDLFALKAVGGASRAEPSRAPSRKLANGISLHRDGETIIANNINRLAFVWAEGWRELVLAGRPGGQVSPPAGSSLALSRSTASRLCNCTPSPSPSRPPSRRPGLLYIGDRLSIALNRPPIYKASESPSISRPGGETHAAPGAPPPAAREHGRSQCWPQQYKRPQWAQPAGLQSDKQTNWKASVRLSAKITCFTRQQAGIKCSMPETDPDYDDHGRQRRQFQWLPTLPPLAGRLAGCSLCWPAS